MAKLLETMETPEMTVWPFLVSRNQVIDYHLLLAPPPLVRQETFFDLLDEVRGSIPPDERLYWKTATIAPFGQVALVYRSLWATEALLGKGEGKQLTDCSERPIKMYEGLLFESPFSSPPVVTAEDFSLLRQYTEVVFRDFWKAGRAASLLQSAPPFPLAQLTRTNPAQLLLKPEKSQPQPPFPQSGQDVPFTLSNGSEANSGLAPAVPVTPLPIPTQKERAEKPDPVLPVPQPTLPVPQPTMNIREKRSRWSRILIKAMLVLLIIIIGAGILFAIFHVIPTFSPTHPPTPTPK